MEDYFAGEVAERYDDDVPLRKPPDDAVEFLLPFAAGGALELAATRTLVLVGWNPSASLPASVGL